MGDNLKFDDYNPNHCIINREDTGEIGRIHRVPAHIIWEAKISTKHTITDVRSILNKMCEMDNKKT